jgi:hypothetical protein
MCLTLSKKFYLIMLFWVRYKITHRIEFRIRKNVVVVEDRRQISILENRKILHSSCLVRCNHFESLHRSRSLRTLSIRMCAQIVVASCLILCSSRTIRSRKIRFLLIFWKIWSFESQMIRFACWKWFNKSETSSRKWIRNTMNNAI